MVILRRTTKLSAALPTSSQPPLESDGALGDWYANRIVVDRRPLLLLVSAKSLLPIVLIARDVKSLPTRLGDIVGRRLARLGIPRRQIESEVRTMEPIVVAKTTDRSVVGIMVDFAFAIPYCLEREGWDETTLPFVEERLARTPCYSSRRSQDVVFPDRDTPMLLAKRWGLPNGGL